MDWITFSQTFINALMLGSTYMLIASGLTLTYSIMRLLNFAHGELYMLGAYSVYFLFGQLGLNFFIALVVAAIVCGVAGIFIERIFFRPLVGQIIPQMVIGLGISIVLSGIALIVFGEKEKGMRHVFTGVIRVLGVTISIERIAVIVICAGVMYGLFNLLKRTKLGYAMRAVAQDGQAARLQGISMPRTNMACFGVSCALAGIAGALLAPLFFIDPFMGGHAFLTAVVVILLGGLGSIAGAGAGGLVLGFIHGFGYTYIGSIAELLGFLVIYFILIFRPQGLMGHE
jgi:branched-chain amino acid transport system permease protein